MISFHGIWSIDEVHNGQIGATGNHWVEFSLSTREGPSRLTLYSDAAHVARVATGLREVADAIEGLAPPEPETSSGEDK